MNENLEIFERGTEAAVRREFGRDDGEGGGLPLERVGLEAGGVGREGGL